MVKKFWTLEQARALDIKAKVFVDYRLGKLILLSQINIVSFVNTFVDVTEQDCIAQFSSISFDAFVFELWVTLSYSASMCIVDSETLLYKNRFYETVTENKISIAFITN
ncbi:hypothetical protein [Photorhabdus viridis]|uniref:hypothetical protein n=1 Tax=Photorhabdus viridis TaxID=3163327 RepID=UPI003306D1B7